METPKESTVRTPIFMDGYIVNVNNIACIFYEFKQTRYPKSRKKRIRNKCAKNPKYKSMVESHRAVKINNIIYVSQLMYDLIIEETKKLK